MRNGFFSQILRKISKFYAKIPALLRERRVNYMLRISSSVSLSKTYRRSEILSFRERGEWATEACLRFLEAVAGFARFCIYPRNRRG